MTESRKAARHVRLPQQIPLAFWAFHDRYKHAYRVYAELQLGDKPLAGRIVHHVFLDLLRHWTCLMEEANPAATAWAQLKGTVAGVLQAQGRTSAIAENATFSRVRRSVLEGARDEFAAMESSIGLYTALSRLPDRQFDVMILRYVIGYTRAQTGSILGVTEATVRSHDLRARQRVADDLGLKLGPETE